MPDHSGLDTPTLMHPCSGYHRGCLPIGQGGEAGMKPREGKHASNPRGFRGGGFRPPRGALDPLGRPPGFSFLTLQVRDVGCAPACAGASVCFHRSPPTSRRAWCRVPSASSQAPGLYTSGRFSLSLRLQTAEPLGSPVQLGPKAVQAPGLQSQRAERCFTFRSKTPSRQRAVRPQGLRRFLVASCPAARHRREGALNVDIRLEFFAGLLHGDVYTPDCRDSQASRRSPDLRHRRRPPKRFDNSIAVLDVVDALPPLAFWLRDFGNSYRCLRSSFRCLRISYLPGGLGRLSRWDAGLGAHAVRGTLSGGSHAATAATRRAGGVLHQRLRYCASRTL